MSRFVAFSRRCSKRSTILTRSYHTDSRPPTSQIRPRSCIYDSVYQSATVSRRQIRLLCSSGCFCPRAFLHVFKCCPIVAVIQVYGLGLCLYKDFTSACRRRRFRRSIRQKTSDECSQMQTEALFSNWLSNQRGNSSRTSLAEDPIPSMTTKCTSLYTSKDIYFYFMQLTYSRTSYIFFRLSVTVPFNRLHTLISNFK
jgi:hypothetical protein